MTDINGFDNEYKFVDYLNGKRIKELNPLFRAFINDLYGYLDDKFVVYAWRNHMPQKTDIFIKINEIKKGISIKKGIKNSVHLEAISEFVHFLIENKVDREVIIEYLKYHYADGSTNGKGINRISVKEYKIMNQDKIDKINNAFNQEKLLLAAINRFILKGNNSEHYVDAIIYGEVDDFLWILKKDIRNVIMSKRSKYSTAVHFGPITCQPLARNLSYNPGLEKRRFCVQLKWYNLCDDIIENMNNKVITGFKN